MRTALTGLTASQVVLRTTANNITNLNTPGYVRQEIQLETQVTGTGGVTVTEIRRYVDRFLQSELVRSIGGTAYYEKQAQIHDRLQALLGDPANDTALNNLIDDIFASFNALSLDPSQTARQLGSIEDLRFALSQIDRMAKAIQSLREESDRQIGVDVRLANDMIARIHELNTAITTAGTRNQDSAALEEHRDQAIEELAKLIDIRVLPQPSGAIHISTTSGTALLDQIPRVMVYDPVGQVDTTTRFNAITIHNLDPTTGLPAAQVGELDPALLSGEIKALIDMRDTELPEIAEMFGAMAASLVDEFNRVHNENVTGTPPNTLTGGDVGALGADPHGFTGEATFAVLDANNEITEQVTIDFTGGGYTTLTDVINAVNAGLGTATLTLVAGVMTFDATNGADRVAIVQDATNPSERAGRGFSHFFGMNDLVSARVPVFFDTGLAGADTHGFGTSGTTLLELRGPGGQVVASHTLDFAAAGADIDALITELNTNMGPFVTFALDANGRITATPASGYGDYGIHVVNDSTQRGATSVSFSEFFGIGRRLIMDAAINLEVRAEILSDASKLALHRVDLSAGAGISAITSGDNQGAVAFHALQSKIQSFVAAGDLPAINVSISGYVGYVISTLSAGAARAEGLATDREALKLELLARRSAESGVNLDEELANMIIFQNAYNAAARLITTVNSMFDRLMEMTR